MKQRIVVSATALVLVGGVTAAAMFAVQHGTHKPRTISIAAGAGFASEGAKATSAAIDSAIAPMPPRDIGVTFVLKGQLPALDGDQSAWQFTATPEPDQAAVARLAKAFGVADASIMTADGVVVHGGPLQTGPALVVNKGAGLPWAFNSGSSLMMGETCSVSSSSDPNVPPAPPVCTGPPKPANVPSAADAKVKAIALLDAAGIDHANATVTATENDGWTTIVQFGDKLDGIEVPPLGTMISFGAKGAVEYANGYLARPVKADSYPRLGTTAAFESLKTDGAFFGGFYGAPYGVPYSSVIGTKYAEGIAVSTTIFTNDGIPTPTTTAPTATATSISGLGPDTTYPYLPQGDTIAPPPPIDQGPICGTVPVTTIPGQPPVPQSCLPVCEWSGGPAPTAAVSTEIAPVLDPAPCPAPQPRTVTIDSVRETLIDVSGTDGSRWLVPGYLFGDTDGGQWPVLAIDKSYIHIAPAPVPLPVETSVAAPLISTVDPCYPLPPTTVSLPPGQVDVPPCPMGTIVGGSTGSGGAPASEPKATMVPDSQPPTT